MKKKQNALKHRVEKETLKKRAADADTVSVMLARPHCKIQGQSGLMEFAGVDKAARGQKRG